LPNHGTASPLDPFLGRSCEFGMKRMTWLCICPIVPSPHVGDDEMQLGLVQTVFAAGLYQAEFGSLIE